MLRGGALKILVSRKGFPMIKKCFLPLVLVIAATTVRGDNPKIFNAKVATLTVPLTQQQLAQEKLAHAQNEIRALAVGIMITRMLQHAQNRLLSVQNLSNGNFQHQLGQEFTKHLAQAKQWEAIFGSPADYGQAFQQMLADCVLTSALAFEGFTQGIAASMHADSATLTKTLSDTATYVKEELEVIKDINAEIAETLKKMMEESLAAINKDIKLAEQSIEPTVKAMSTLMVDNIKQMDTSVKNLINTTAVNEAMARAGKNLTEAITDLGNDFDKALREYLPAMPKVVTHVAQKTDEKINTVTAIRTVVTKQQ